MEAKLKAARAANPKPSHNEAPSNVMSQRQTGVAYRVLVDMIAGLLVGGFLGYWLDRWLGWAPYSLVTGLVLGFVAGRQQCLARHSSVLERMRQSRAVVVTTGVVACPEAVCGVGLTCRRHEVGMR